MLVNVPVFVDVGVGTSVLFNVVFWGGDPADRAFGAQVVDVKDTIFVVIEILVVVDAPVAVVVVALQAAVPAYVAPRTGVLVVGEQVVVVIVVAQVAKRIPVTVQLLGVVDVGAVVLAVQHTVGIDVRDVHPSSEVVSIPLFKGVDTEGAVVIGNE